MNSCKIRYASINDIDSIFSIDNSYEFEKYSYNQFLEMYNIDYYHFLVAMSDTKIVGYLCFTKIFDECNLIKIVVSKEFQHQGIGKNLVEFLIHEMKVSGVKKIYLEVRTDNEKAINLYEKTGFKLIDIRKGYYNGIDAKIYGIDLC